MRKPIVAFLQLLLGKVLKCILKKQYAGVKCKYKFPKRNPLTDSGKQDYEISGSKIVGEFLGYQLGHVELVK